MTTYTDIPYTKDSLLGSSTIWLTLTNQCNINCHYCFNYVAKNHQHMAPDLALAIVKAHLRYHQEKQTNLPFYNLLFFGGEPTLNSDALFTVMDYINAEGIACFPKLYTNGVIKPALLDEILARQFYFQLSYDGTQNNVRHTKSGKGDINPIVMQTIKKIKAADQPIELRATIHANNLNAMMEVMQLAIEQGIKQVAYWPIFLDGNAVIYKLEQPKVTAYAEQYKRVKQLAKAHGIKVHSGESNIAQKLKQAHYHFPAIWLPDGKLSSTVQYSTSNMAAINGALVGEFDRESNRIVLDDARIEQMNQNFIAQRQQHCQSCQVAKYCQGLCNFDSYSLNRKFSQRERYQCAVNRQLIAVNVELLRNNP